MPWVVCPGCRAIGASDAVRCVPDAVSMCLECRFRARESVPDAVPPRAGKATKPRLAALNSAICVSDAVVFRQGVIVSFAQIDTVDAKNIK